MTTPGLPQLRLTPVLAIAGAVIGFLLLAGAVATVGPIAALGAVGLALTVLLLRAPSLAVGLAIAVVVLTESDVDSAFGALTSRLYVPVVFLTVTEALLLLAAVAVALDHAAARRMPALPHPFVPALVLVAFAVAAGAVTGYFGGTSPGELRSGVRILLALVLSPFLVSAVLRTRRHVRLAIAGLAATAIFKALQGLFAVFGGGGVTVEGETITFYEPTANWVMLLFLLVTVACVLVARADRVRLPLWAYAGWPLVFATLVLSFRRSFWIALVLGLALVAVLGLGRLGRRLAVPVALLLAGGIWMMASVQSFDVGGPLGQRIESLKPSKVQANAQDRYRLDERKNVWEEVRRAPVTGLGIGVGWRATHPLPVEHAGGRQFVHFAALWWWMKMGILGLLAWAALTAAALWTAAVVWRRADDVLVRAVGLGSLAALLGLQVVELTTTFTGAEFRFSVVFGAALGLLSALRRLHAQGRSPESSASIRAVTTSTS